MVSRKEICVSYHRITYNCFVFAGCSGDDGENGNLTSPIDQNLPATLHAILCIADQESDNGEAV